MPFPVRDTSVSPIDCAAQFHPTGNQTRLVEKVLRAYVWTGASDFGLMVSSNIA